MNGTGGAPPYSYSFDGLAYEASDERFFQVDGCDANSNPNYITVKDNESCTVPSASINITCSGSGCSTCPRPKGSGSGGTKKTVETASNTLLLGHYQSENQKIGLFTNLP